MASASAASRRASGGWRVVGFLFILAVVVGLLVLLAGRLTAPPYEPFSVRSPAAGGLLALRVWLEEMGYEVRTGQNARSTQSRLVLLFPGVELNESDRSGLRKWVEEGNTLVIANASGVGLPRTFGVMIQTRQTYSDAELIAVQPLLPSQSRRPAPVSGSTLTTMTPAWYTLPVLQTERGEVAVLVQALGEGLVWHIGIDGALTNADLRSGWGRELVIAALRGVPAGSTVSIVNGEVRSQLETAKGERSGPDGLWQWLLTHPVGWATLSLAALLLFYLFTQGRRLGPPVPVDAPSSRRAGVEHILAIAGLAQRAGHREAVAAYQKVRLKRRLGIAWRVASDVDDITFVAGLAQQGDIAPDKLRALADLLVRLGKPDDEAALVRAVEEANRFSLE